MADYSPARARLDRSRSPGQRIYTLGTSATSVEDEEGACLLRYWVQGSQIKSYYVDFRFWDGRREVDVSCTCPDATQRNYVCKHAWFVIDRVLPGMSADALVDEDGVVHTSDLAFANTWKNGRAKRSVDLVYCVLASREEPDTISNRITADTVVTAPFTSASVATGVSTQEEEAITTTTAASAERREIQVGDECCVCLGPLLNAETEEPSEALLWCDVGCGQAFHEDCALRVISQCGDRCPLCRTSWAGGLTH